MLGVLFPDVTSVLVDFLTNALADRGQTVPVRSQVPNPRTAPFVLVRRLGGTRRDLVTDNAMVGVECWHSSEEQAQDLAQLCRALILSLPGTVQSGVAIYHIDEISGPGDLPDPLSDNPRFTFTHQIAVRGQAL